MQLLESTRSVLIQLVWCQTKKKKILFLQSHFYCVCMRDRHNKVFVCGQQQTEFFLPLSPGLNRKLSSHLKVDHELHMPRNQNFESGCKVIYPKYFRHWPYLLASTMDCCWAAVYCSRFQVLLDVQSNLPETIPISSAQITVLSSFFQIFLVLEMYNFESGWLCDAVLSSYGCWWKSLIIFYFWKKKRDEWI